MPDIICRLLCRLGFHAMKHTGENWRGLECWKCQRQDCEYREWR